MKVAILVFAAAALAGSIHAAQIHVSPTGKDRNPGTRSKPLRTIQSAADIAGPGDVVTIHQGTYRERIDPPRSGTSDNNRITYQAAPGEHVEIKGSEIVQDWQRVRDDVWSVTLPNSYFGDFNPYSDVIHGNWFNPNARTHHTGAVYLDGDWLVEASSLDDVMKPPAAALLWFANVDDTSTTIHAQFGSADPNHHVVEINVRRTVFYPTRTGINYLTIRGLHVSQAATPWAPPTAEQVAVIGTNWSKDWIIENNQISYSTCSGISLGKYGDEWDNKGESAEGYVATIHRALDNGWNKKTIGHHLVRNNTISHCEQAGIVGSLGAVFSTITGNSIHDIHIRQLFTGAEQAGIKIHAALDCTISNNHIYHSNRGIWLDWMGQGTRITRNLLHDNTPHEDIFLEVDHGPLLLDNNLSLSTNSLTIVSQGCAYVHNLIAGRIVRSGLDARQTPFLRRHSTQIAGMHDNPPGDERYLNNIFANRADLTAYDNTTFSIRMAGNVFINGAKPSKHEPAPRMVSAKQTTPTLTLRDGHYYLSHLPRAIGDARRCKPVTSKVLGKAAISGLGFENPDTSSITIDRDYFQHRRKPSTPTPGPFETLPSRDDPIQLQ